MAPKRKLDSGSGETTSKKLPKVETKALRSPGGRGTSKSVKKSETPSKSNAEKSDFDLLSYLHDKSWKAKIEEMLKTDQRSKNNFHSIKNYLEGEYKKTGVTIFPPKEQIFNSLHLTPLDKVKVCIVGQDPYHDNGQAHGLSFSVPKGIKKPPSLKNIFKELKVEYPDFSEPDHGCLEKWAEQGVLLLNATLTVEAHKSNSHAKIGWMKFTDTLIKIINDNCEDVVFILWGLFAHKKGKIINKTKHHVIETAHPSPLSVKKFMNCKCFLKADALLEKAGKMAVNWKDL
ncbi:uracil-DNA glycosylase-like [Saccoglossus kowalevskii]|uniref:Uracil-DNA glycosylase n=1 Tax=Saccoglossus kowalevskii TaxID=10224 RepID=A0ABM0H1J8_SACKO|nr:PREDICTED: uracil-DNA glycosylase-like [Saccoglossus kowalevskii]